MTTDNKQPTQPVAVRLNFGFEPQNVVIQVGDTPVRLTSADSLDIAFKMHCWLMRRLMQSMVKSPLQLP